MWDYDKLFAEGNIVGFYVGLVKSFSAKVIDEHQNKILHNCYKNNSLSYCPDYCSKETETKIQYIIRLDEHGNVIEKLFDREADMPKPMPELETGMFVRVNGYGGSRIGFVDAENNHVIYQEGGYDFIDDDDINGRGIASEIVEVYSKDTCAFDFCTKDNLIWRKTESN